MYLIHLHWEYMNNVAITAYMEIQGAKMLGRDLALY